MFNDLPKPKDLLRARKHLKRAERILIKAQPGTAGTLRDMMKQLKMRARLLEASK